MSTAWYYDESKNPEGATIPGVPLRDLTEDEFKALPEWDRNSVEKWDAYRKTNPAPTPRKRGHEDKELDADG